MKIYSGGACGLVSLVGHCERIYLDCVCFIGLGRLLRIYILWECVWFFVTGMTLHIYIFEVRVVWWKR